MKQEMPPIVCICGSTRFKQAWISENARLTGEGYIVLAVGLWGHHERVFPDEVTKKKLDELHLRKIDLCDWVWVLDIGGYIGESTRNEIAYARSNGKEVRYLSHHFPRYVESEDTLLAAKEELETQLCRAREWLVTAKTLNGTECSYHDPHRKKYAIKERCGKCILCLIDYAMTVHLNDAPCPHCASLRATLSRAEKAEGALEGIERLYSNWRGRFPSLAEAIKRHTGNQDALIRELRRDNDVLRGADPMIRAIEEQFPDWRNYRDLSECVRMKFAEIEKELHDERAQSMDPRVPDAHWCDEDGKEYVLKWDHGDRSVGIWPGYTCEELDALHEEAKQLREAVEWACSYIAEHYTGDEEKEWIAAELRLRAAMKEVT